MLSSKKEAHSLGVRYLVYIYFLYRSHLKVTQVFFFAGLYAWTLYSYIGQCVE